MSDYKTSIGNVEIIALSDGNLDFALDEFFPSVPAEAWEPYRDQLTPKGTALMNMGSFLLRSDGKTVLIDTGLGEETHGLETDSHGLLMKDLKAKGLRADEVDIVMITHLHRDHVGWNMVWDDDVYRPTFPKARYWIPKTDWDFYTERARIKAFAYIKDQVMPLEGIGVLDLVDGETALTSELLTLPTPGHTPGHTSVLISSQGERGVILGDAAHVPAQVQETEWSPRADIDPDTSRATRLNLMDRAERDNALVVSGHFPAPGYGRLMRLQGRRYWKAL